MTVIPTPVADTLSRRVAEEIRGILGRRAVSQAQLARALGRSQMWVSDRLRGAQPIDLDDLEAIASVLGIQPIDLFSAAEGATTLREPAPRIPAPRRPADNRPTSGPSRETTRGVRPSRRPRYGAAA